METKETFELEQRVREWWYSLSDETSQEYFNILKVFFNSYHELILAAYHRYAPNEPEHIQMRKLAIEWWNSLPDSLNNGNDKQSYYDAYKINVYTVATNYSELTGREIQNIWAVETNRTNEDSSNQKNVESIDLSKVDSFELIKELKNRGYHTGLLWSRDDVQMHLPSINQDLDEDETPIELTDDDMDDILHLAIDVDYHCQIINSSIFDTIWNDYKK